MKVTKKLWSTAYHEAGHAAVAYELRVAVKKVTIDPTEDSLGHISHQKLLDDGVGGDNSNRYRWRMEKLVMVALAGYHAEKRFNPKGLRHYAFTQDRQNTAAALDYFCGDSAEVEAYSKLLDLWTQGHLRKPWVWIGVERLAEALIERRTLNGKQTRQILQDARKEYFNTSMEKYKEKK